MVLKGMTWDHPRGYECLVAASAKYAELTGVSIEWDKRSLQAFADAPIDQIASSYDFVVLDHPHVGIIADQGALTPLPMPEDQDASLGGSAESYVWKNTCWAYAIDASCQMAAYRPDLTFRLPKTWEDLLGDEGASFKALTPLLPVDAIDMFMTLVAGRDEEQQAVLTDSFVSEQNGLYALEVLKGLYRLGPSEAVGMNPIKVLEALTTTDEFHCSPCLFGYVNYSRRGFRPYTVSYFDLPLSQGHTKRRGILGGAGIGVSAKTQDAVAALAFAKWVSSEPVQSGVYLENEGQPAHRYTWLNKKSDPDYSGFFDGSFNTISEAWTRPRDAWFLGFIDDVCEIFPDFFLKDQSCEAFLKKLNTAYRHHIKGA